MRELRVLLYGDINFNMMDGSAVWLSSMGTMLSQNPNVRVDLLLKTEDQNQRFTGALSKIPNLRLIRAHQDFGRVPYKAGHCLSVAEAVELMKRLNTEHPYDLIIVRGFALVREIMKDDGLTAKTVPYLTDFKHDQRSTAEERKDLQAVYERFDHLFLQTKETKAAFQKLIGVDGGKIELLYPMVPDNPEIPSFRNQHNRMIYSGKFHVDWYTEEILSAVQKMRQTNPEITYQIVGDKFQDVLRTKERREPIVQALKTTEGLTWYGAIPREDCQELIKEADLGISWRSKYIDNDDSVELSSKLLEYGRLGKPALVRRTVMHEAILGADYPLFVDTEADFIQKSTAILQDPALYKKAAKQIYVASKQFTFQAAYERLKPFLWSFKKEPIKIVFAGHDLKFAAMIMTYFKQNPAFEVKIDQWDSHSKHDEKHSEACVKWADIVFCEWGLGNAVWYSKHKQQNQKLLVRMHFQEKDLAFPQQMDVDKVDKIIVITPYMLEEFHRIFGIPRSKMMYFDNLIDAEKLDAAKLPGSEFHLGICGILPARKRLDLAVDILEKLWEKDSRYKLFVKSKMPQELPWLMARETERTYYEQLFARIEKAPWKENVIFDEHGNDVHDWLRKIGYFLSVSDYEGSHVAVSEGIASGSFPVIRDWKGADTIYPAAYIHPNIDAMVDYIATHDRGRKEAQALKDYAKEKFDKQSIVKQIETLITQLFTS